MTDSDESLTEIVDIDARKIKNKTRKIRVKRKRPHHTITGNRLYEPSKNPESTAYVPFEELDKAVRILNEKGKVKRNGRSCSKSSINNVMIHKTLAHYCELIKHAIFKQNWRSVGRLLTAYINEKKIGDNYDGLIFKYAILYLQNDPIAIENQAIKKFLQLGVSCRTDEEQNKVLRTVMTFDHEYANE